MGSLNAKLFKKRKGMIFNLMRITCYGVNMNLCFCSFCGKIKMILGDGSLGKKNIR